MEERKEISHEKVLEEIKTLMKKYKVKIEAGNSGYLAVCLRCGSCDFVKCGRCGVDCDLVVSSPVATRRTAKKPIEKNYGSTVTVVQSDLVHEPPEPLPKKRKRKSLPRKAPDEVSELITDAEEMEKKKLWINLNKKGAMSQLDEEREVCPEKVLKKIEAEVNGYGSKFRFVRIECRSIRVGTYKVTKEDTSNRALVATLTDLGMTFSLPFSKRLQMKKICIPIEQIIYLKGNLTRKLPVIFIQTGPKFAMWVRDILGLDGNPEDEASNYYCPVNGSPCQRAITLLPVNFTDQDVGLIRNMYKDKLVELDKHTTNQYLMDVTPQSFKSSIDFKPADAASPANAISARLDGGSSVPGRAEESPDSEAPLLFYEAKGSKIPIFPKDISCLAYGEHLNDQIIDFWLAVIQTEILSEEDRKRTFVFDSCFFSKLTDCEKKKIHENGTLPASERRHARVKRRTKNVDIFEKDFLIVPINEAFHWFVAVICFPGLKGYHDYDTLEPLSNYQSSNPEQRVKRPCIIIFDSLASDERSRIYATLREYLRVEHKTRKNEEIVLDKNMMPGIMPKVPQQPNYNDEGLFMLQYIESFFRSPIHSYGIRKGFYLLDWFSQSIVANKRREIFEFIRNKVEEKCPQNLARISDVNFEPPSDCDENIGEDDEDLSENFTEMETNDEDGFVHGSFTVCKVGNGSYQWRK